MAPLLLLFDMHKAAKSKSIYSKNTKTVS